MSALHTLSPSASIRLAAAKPIPDGYHSVTPYIYVKGASDAIAFYEKAFGAVEIMRMDWNAKR